MDSFVVSALKYRPKTFEEVVGQESITQTLENSLKTNQLAQALLFCGPRGVGKTSCARILAKQINSGTSHTEEDFAFNIFELDAASNNSVEDIRKINEQVRIPPQVGSHKIYIIDEAHMLSNAAFNAFLKTLEEPPKHAIFILATTEKNKIIPTVLSRCQVYDFKRISVQDIQKYLSKIAINRDLQFEESALYLIAQKAEGALRDALSVFDRMVSFTNGNLSAATVAENLNLLDHQTYAELGQLIFSREISELLRRYDELIQRGIDGLQFIKGFGDYYRNLIFAKDLKTVRLMEVGEAVKENYQADTKKLATNYLIDAIALLNTCELNYKSVRNKRVHVELTLMQLASLHFDGEKKKGYILPASELKSSPVSGEGASLNYSVKEPAVPLKSKKEESIEEETVQKVIENYENKSHPIKNTNIPVSNFSLSSIALKKAAKNINKPKEIDSELPKDPFDLETLDKLWKHYTEKIKNKGKQNMAAILSMHPIQLNSDNSIQFSVANELNKVELEGEMENLLPFLRKELNNYSLKIKIDVLQNIKEDTIYTTTEKYQHLLKVNPILDTLRKNFDLNF